jgi:hypothetical protein
MIEHFKEQQKKQKPKEEKQELNWYGIFKKFKEWGLCIRK